MRHNEIWCTHVGQEIPVLVYALLIAVLAQSRQRNLKIQILILEVKE